MTIDFIMLVIINYLSYIQMYSLEIEIICNDNRSWYAYKHNILLNWPS